MTQLFSLLPKLAWLIIGAVLILLGLGLLIWVLTDGHRGKGEPAHTREVPSKPRAKGPVWYGISAIGDRATQQDCMIIPDGTLPQQLLRERGLLTIVCDGMGGMEGGERASRTCAEHLYKTFYGGMPVSPAEFFRRRIPEADAAVSALKGEGGKPLHGGTTVVTTIVKDGRLYWASVGDSRIYLYRRGMLQQLTRDHNYFLTLMEKVRRGEISEIEAHTHPQKEALISYVGMGEIDILDIEREGILLQPGDIAVLCSDGVYKALADNEISAVLETYAANPADLPAALVNTALAKTWMKHDNTTVAIVKYE